MALGDGDGVDPSRGMAGSPSKLSRNKVMSSTVGDGDGVVDPSRGIAGSPSKLFRNKVMSSKVFACL